MASGDPFKLVHSGESLSIPAQAWNEMLTMAREHRARVGNQTGAQFEVAGVRFASVINNSSNNVNQFGVMGLNGIATPPSSDLPTFQYAWVLTGGTVSAYRSFANFAIAAEPILSGQVGLAVLSGVCPVQINVNSTCHRYADAKDNDQTQLNSGSAGSAKILWINTGSGTQWAIVETGGVPQLQSALKINGHSGSGPIDFYPYPSTMLDGSTTSARNAMEPMAGAQEPTLPTDTTGTLTGGTCVGQPVGTTSRYIPATFIVAATFQEWTFLIPTSYK